MKFEQQLTKLLHDLGFGHSANTLFLLLSRGGSGRRRGSSLLDLFSVTMFPLSLSFSFLFAFSAFTLLSILSSGALRRGWIARRRYTAGSDWQTVRLCSIASRRCAISRTGVLSLRCWLPASRANIPRWVTSLDTKNDMLDIEIRWQILKLLQSCTYRCRRLWLSRYFKWTRRSGWRWSLWRSTNLNAEEKKDQQTALAFRKV